MKIQEIVHKIISNKKQSAGILLILCLGILLMMTPTTSSVNETALTEENHNTEFSVVAEERRLEEILSCIKGVNGCRVLLSIHNGSESVLAEDDGETVVLSGSGKQSTVTIQTLYPDYQGAIIVAGGSEIASVRYDILSSVMAYTGLGADKITICPIKD